jgi:hypothetical protein
MTVENENEILSEEKEILHKELAEIKLSLFASEVYMSMFTYMNKFVYLCIYIYMRYC